ncbi:hypothetical protein [Saccharolobus islandicus]|uniref:Uncharacterized protein n=1 Tax=Saccharolobus islandicus (strain L.D.8.5 / Lassen \|nr:hypothetical protein [Sulfolobus islandicus]ADB87497.1 hypothetical protein LD85_1840 [Sulfolobus islandicus L.D.8.5]
MNVEEIKSVLKEQREDADNLMSKAISSNKLVNIKINKNISLEEVIYIFFILFF